jgi:predicted nucleic acid-binding protein
VKVLFDTSVLVPALVEQLSNHAVCFETLRAYTSDGNIGVCSTHCLAECYSTLTALPLPRRVSPQEALALIERSVIGKLEVVELETADYQAALAKVVECGLTSGIIYDALHARVATKAGCQRIYTYNHNHFRPLCLANVLVSAP